MNEKGHTLEISQPVISWLIDKSFHEDFGARPLKRGIEKLLEDPLSEQILKGKLGEPYAIKANLDGDDVSFDMVKLPQEPKAEKAPAAAATAASKEPDEEPSNEE